MNHSLGIETHTVFFLLALLKQNRNLHFLLHRSIQGCNRNLHAKFQVSTFISSRNYNAPNIAICTCNQQVSQIHLLGDCHALTSDVLNWGPSRWDVSLYYRLWEAPSDLGMVERNISLRLGASLCFPNWFSLLYCCFQNVGHSEGLRSVGLDTLQIDNSVAQSQRESKANYKFQQTSASFTYCLHI